MERICKDCDPNIRKPRPAPHPGPRCETHKRAKAKADKARKRDLEIQRTYGISGDDYRAILEAQGGKCFICSRATGATKSLSVDHDHKCCPERKSCGNCVRAIICGACNRGVLGHLRDDSDALLRAIEVVVAHPAQKVLEERRGR
ncbi:endonuclease VII domain-containing protein [Nocardia sp. NPDC057440]|uniref:endonuclease VII domain-containing protein n=1 Tax=Nocardia sp. NPDC057440 TaxID=3346134 RepID=UPI00366FBDE0